jgi:hypothetical protein
MENQWHGNEGKIQVAIANRELWERGRRGEEGWERVALEVDLVLIVLY